MTWKAEQVELRCTFATAAQNVEEVLVFLVLSRRIFVNLTRIHEPTCL
jgi:predicted small metal-binding protein